jgi:GTP cyclohydrolase II
MAIAALPVSPLFPDGLHSTAVPRVWIITTAKLPTRWGDFTIVSFGNNHDRRDHLAIVRGEVDGKSEVPVRVHSECLTGDVLGSVRCDCRDQLEAALSYLGQQEFGVLLYMRQEGRGIGLVNKIRAYALQDAGLDTVEANHALGFADDERDYGIAAEMLKALGVVSIRLMSNNPRKIEGLRAAGITIVARIPHIMPVRRHNKKYLETKARKSGHLIDKDALMLAVKM